MEKNSIHSKIEPMQNKIWGADMEQLIIEKYTQKDLPEMMKIWNLVVEAGQAFPQEDSLDLSGAEKFFQSQTCCGVARKGLNGPVLGLYILHPNNVGRCGHICNASFAVLPEVEGKGIGRALVQDCIQKAAMNGFRIMQFNAVVADNAGARHLYEELGFNYLGLISEGFRDKSGRYKDICLYWRKL